MSNLKKLTLLHSNDLHGDFLAQEVDKDLVGGVSLLSGYIQKVRYDEDNVIYCIAGDMFRGSIIDSEYKGVSTIQLMNALAPNVVTIGNHEVDYGIAHLLFIEKCANFPIVNANLYIKSNGTRLFNPYYIEEIDGMKILFIGVITQEVISSTKSEEVIGTLVDTEDAAVEVGKICNAFRGDDIDFTVLLTHIGIEEDKKLASLLRPEYGVDLIVGGHSHTFLKEPVYVNGIPIVQAGTGTDGIGRCDITINTDTNSIEHMDWQFVPINDKTCPVDNVIADLVNHLKDQTDAKYSRVVTTFETKLTHPRRNQETALGNLIADIVQESLKVDVAFYGSGSIRCEEMGPIVTLGILNEGVPYHSTIYELKVTGDILRRIIMHILRDDARVGHTEFYQISKGMKVVYSKSRRELIECSLNGEEIKGDKIYTISIQDFHFKNFDEFFGVPIEEVNAIAKPRVVATNEFDVILETISESQLYYREVEGRWTILD